MPSREDVLLARLRRDSALLLEIGPSTSPIAAKRDGWNTKVVDHADRNGLIEKYAGHANVDVSRIEDVDYVWTGGPISDVVPSELHGKFDGFIASHVIEHVTDIIGFFTSAAKLLKQDGVVILAVPDKRYIFDAFQPVTTTGDVLRAEGLSRHPPASAFQHYGYAVSSGGSITWGQSPTQPLNFIHSFDEATEALKIYANDDQYHDLHAWHFTPAAFELIILELNRLGKIDLRFDRGTDANGCEFYVWLKKGGRKSIQSYTEIQFNTRRMRLLKRCLLEQRTQIDWLLAGEPTLLDIQQHAAENEGVVLPVAQADTGPSLPRYVDWAPSPQNAVRVFEGEWSSLVPGLSGTGGANLFADQRILEFERRLGSLNGKHVLELGPLEGGHTFMMTQRGARVLGIESNVRAWQRCLIVKNHLNMDRATFLLGDFTKYLENPSGHFDFLLASGVLYHMTDPVTVLQNMCKVSRSIGLWTHYFDPAVMQAHEQRNKFSFAPEHTTTRHGRKVELYNQQYLQALHWSGFCGGSAEGSKWMRKDDIVNILSDEGYHTEIFLDEPHHQNGASFCVFATR
jgi:SAM-dependent methyltransferase